MAKPEKMKRAGIGKPVEPTELSALLAGIGTTTQENRCAPSSLCMFHQAPAPLCSACRAAPGQLMHQPH